MGNPGQNTLSLVLQFHYDFFNFLRQRLTLELRMARNSLCSPKLALNSCQSSCLLIYGIIDTDHYMAMVTFPIVLFLKGLEESSYVIKKQSMPASRLAQSLLTSPTPAHKLPFSHSHVTLEKKPSFLSVFSRREPWQLGVNFPSTQSGFVY